MAAIILAETLPTEQPSKATLLTLPAELRNSIYRLALLHEEGGGIISPCGSATSRGVVLEGDTRFRIKSNKPIRLKAFGSASDEVKAAVAKEYSRKSTFAISIACVSPLSQKSLCKVRNETLPVFYSVNKIHLELDNFAAGRSCKSPATWWRAIGDTSLRLICRFNFFFATGLMIRYRRPQTGEQLTSTGNDDDFGYAESVRDQDKVRRIIDGLAVDRLHVRALQCLAASQNLYWGAFLPDLGALEGPQY